MRPLVDCVNKKSCDGASHRNSLRSIAERNVAFAAMFLSLVCGCSQESVQDQTKSQQTFPLIVNNVHLTDEDIQNEIDFRVALVRHTRPRVKQEIARQRITASVTNALISGYLYKTAANSQNIQANESITNSVLDLYCRTFTGGRTNLLAQLETMLEKDGLKDVYQNNLDREICREAYLEARHGDEFHVTDKDVDDYLKRIKRFNETAAATNALVYAKATNLWNQIKTGADFAELADRESEDAERAAGGDLGECEQIDFVDCPGYWERVSSLTKGEITEVFTTDVGVEIVKALTSLGPSESTGNPSLRLARIYLRRPAFMPVPDRNNAHDDLVETWHREAMGKAFSEVSSNATVIVNGKPWSLKGNK